MERMESKFIVRDLRCIAANQLFFYFIWSTSFSLPIACLVIPAHVRCSPIISQSSSLNNFLSQAPSFAFLRDALRLVRPQKGVPSDRTVQMICPSCLFVPLQTLADRVISISLHLRGEITIQSQCVVVVDDQTETRVQIIRTKWMLRM